MNTLPMYPYTFITLIHKLTYHFKIQFRSVKFIDGVVALLLYVHLLGM